ncbi:ABC transporter ATP-binding protein [Virgifigura deserti]|uniref:ABC transporter ATP-binding protein n=1 Tax=Virgifigura deserti TaxID=2268457 RepID=UPI003CCB94C6
MTERSARDWLVVQDVTKDFKGLRALDAVRVGLERGEILGLIGPNGSGKTTLINVITGVLPPTSGGITACGRDITGLPSFKIARAGIARTFQTVRLFRDLTVGENIEVAALSVGKSRRAARRAAEEAIDELGIAHWTDEFASVLPYGDERRVEVARALAMTPDFLLLDEPAAGLNEQESEDLLRILAPIPTRRNLGMLIVDHDMHLIMRLCDRLHVLNYGRTIGAGEPAEVRRIPAVIEAYLGSAAEEGRDAPA